MKKELMEDLQQIADYQGSTLMEIIRQALRQYVKNNLKHALDEVNK